MTYRLKYFTFSNGFIMNYKYKSKIEFLGFRETYVYK